MRNWLRIARIKKGMSLSDLANKVHIDRTHLSKIENGKRNPSPSVAKAIAGIVNENWTRFYEDV